MRYLSVSQVLLVSHRLVSNIAQAALVGSTFTPVTLFPSLVVILPDSFKSVFSFVGSAASTAIALAVHTLTLLIYHYVFVVFWCYLK